jgi:formylglycine-generating enzyme required for sulfatase activity
MVLISPLVLAVAAALLATSASALVRIDWVPVGNPGNAPDTATNCLGANCGEVDYNYFISKYDVTNAQYADFLNAVDPGGSNSLALWNSNMSSTGDGNGGINFVSTNASGSKYVVNSGFANDPVVCATFYSALRFANWLNNGQGSGDTETGAYTITADGITNNTITRNPGAIVFLPSENEWYKAAYYNPVTLSYFAYPYGTNTPTACAAPGAAPNSANCDFAVGRVSNVGAYTNSVSPYGTYDMGGNVFQWNELADSTGSGRGLRGGSWDGTADILAASGAFTYSALFEFSFIGFRVASLTAANPPSACGTGGEVALTLPLLMWVRSRRRRVAA